MNETRKTEEKLQKKLVRYLKAILYSGNKIANISKNCHFAQQCWYHKIRPIPDRRLKNKARIKNRRCQIRSEYSHVLPDITMGTRQLLPDASSPSRSCGPPLSPPAPQCRTSAIFAFHTSPLRKHNHNFT